ncbi:hypothetical protein [Micromonospora sp. NPDC051006]|uniref:CdiA C-terminal domain-containing protein n=1 Tax=Micromonospora sp. NPDC051006 TaxID=3364283 RepID=UPI0037B79D22
MADRGYRVHQNPTTKEIAEARLKVGDSGESRRDPDFLLEGLVFDCYSPTSDKAVRGVWSEVRGKIEKSQTQRVVLNLTDWTGDLTALRQQFDDWPIDRLKELVALTPNGAIVQIVRRD